MSESQIEKIPTTVDPDNDKFPHYYEGSPGGHIHSTLVHAEDIGIASGVVGVGFHHDDVTIDLEGDGGLVSMGMSIGISPEDARKAAQSLLMCAEIAEEAEQ